jgi:hypothetical protein
VRRVWQELAVGTHHLLGLLERPERRSGQHGAHRMQSEIGTKSQRRSCRRRRGSPRTGRGFIGARARRGAVVTDAEARAVVAAAAHRERQVMRPREADRARDVLRVCAPRDQRWPPVDHRV